MKKSNKWMRTGALLVVLTLVTSTLVGGTFAKYVSKGSATDSARVAKWGVTIETKDYSGNESEGLFRNTYTNNGNTVVGESGAKVIAPGTKGNLADFTITAGKPEVASEVTLGATLTFEGNWKDGTSSDGSEYCPLIFTVDLGAGAGEKKFFIGQTVSNTGLQDSEVNSHGTIQDMADLKLAVETYIEKGSKKYLPGHDYTNETLPITVGWEWEFEQSTVTGQTDQKDTDLGNRAVNDGGSVPKVSLVVNASVEQINDATDAE